MNHEINIRKLTRKEEMLQAYKIIKQRYPHIDFNNYEKQLIEMIEMNDFKIIAAFLGEEIVGIAGYWILRMLYCGRYIQVSSFIVDEEKRGFGIGKKILQEIEKIGKELGCDKVVLDSYTENKKSHSLYFKEGFHIRGLHFMKDL